LLSKMMSAHLWRYVLHDHAGLGAFEWGSPVSRYRYL
jgi:hypothetical protein